MEVAGEGKPERKSFLSRLASKRKSRNVTKDEADAAVAGTTAGTAGEDATADDNDEAKKSIESPEATRDSTQESEVVGAPISPVHTRDAPGSASKTKPDLERHITNIETSSESESDAEEDRARKQEKKRKSALGWLSGGAAKSDDEKADKAVTPEPEEPKKSIEQPSPIAPATASTTATKSLTDEPRESTASSRPDVEKEKKEDGKRLRGFFSKLRNRQSSKAERKPGSFSASSPKEKEEAKKAAVGEDSTKPAAITAADDPRSASPSSFNRHRVADNEDGNKSSTDLGDVSSLSSSGLEEDDLQPGRTGRMARALGLNKGKGKAADVSKDDEELEGKKRVSTSKNDEDDSDQFEEARDHFDEGLAPRPSFGGQAKSASPARETKFHEEV